MFTRSLPVSVDVSVSSLLPFTHILDIPALCSDVNVMTFRHDCWFCQQKMVLHHFLHVLLVQNVYQRVAFGGDSLSGRKTHGGPPKDCGHAV